MYKDHPSYNEKEISTHGMLIMYKSYLKPYISEWSTELEILIVGGVIIVK